MKITLNISNLMPKAGKKGLPIIRFSTTFLFDGEPSVTVDGNLYYNDRTVQPPKIQRGPQIVWYSKVWLDKIKLFLDNNPIVQNALGEMEEAGDILPVEGDIE